MKLPAIAFPQEALHNFGEAIQKEWLITNGLGSYASSTVLGLNTRKYHGLLVAALHPPGDRTVILSKLDEDIIVGKAVYQLGSNEFKRHRFILRATSCLRLFQLRLSQHTPMALAL